MVVHRRSTDSHEKWRQGIDSSTPACEEMKRKEVRSPMASAFAPAAAMERWTSAIVDASAQDGYGAGKIWGKGAGGKG